ncbi:MAG: polysaccharide deacetylase family protein [Lachnospiraceae bacterium]|nr:polysaccharide deacetylase family protein [Lachnospiraceae bacterium]
MSDREEKKCADAPAEGRKNQSQRKKMRERKKRRLMISSIILGVLCVVLIICILFATKIIKFGGNSAAGSKEEQMAGTGPETQSVSQVSAEVPKTEEPKTDTDTGGTDRNSCLAQAEELAVGYDYDGAIALLQAYPGYDTDSDMTAKINEYNTAKSGCVAVDVDTVPHIFYHSLINDTNRAFNVAALGQPAVDGFNAWMTTVEEFDKITQQMYDNGYVLVRLRDLVVQTTDADGTVHFAKNTNLMLPAGKKAFVLSIDDLSYYHSYAAEGYPEKLVLDDNGLVKCLYTDADGNTSVGDYDVVPRLNTFLREHPDGAYHGARGMIAMTGYNGVFGYRTDSDYRDRLALKSDQQAWLDAHPDFNYDQEIADATVIANAIKAEGWEFASHTWGHISVTTKTAEQLKTDNEKWIANVQNIVGPVDTIIFAHGNDIGDWRAYASDNDRYNYYKSVGYNFFCNVDGSVPYWVQITDSYVRQGRIDLDGYMLYKESIGETDVCNSMFDAANIFDSRRPTPVVANGQS